MIYDPSMSLKNMSVLKKLFLYLHNKDQIPCFLYVFQDLCKEPCEQYCGVDVNNIMLQPEPYTKEHYGPTGLDS